MLHDQLGGHVKSMSFPLTTHVFGVLFGFDWGYGQGL